MHCVIVRLWFPLFTDDGGELCFVWGSNFNLLLGFYMLYLGVFFRPGEPFWPFLVSEGKFPYDD